MATLRRLLFFLVLVILGAGGYSQSKKSEELLRRAHRGDAKAQYFLGTMYDFGAGVPRDYKEAVKWYRKAAEQGVPPCQYS